MDRVPSDHRTIDQYRGTVVTHGTGRNRAVELPDAVSVPVGEVIRLSLSGTEYHAQFERFAEGVRVTGAFETPTLARTPRDGTNMLDSWLTDKELSAGRSVHLDVIDPDFKYGLRAPGERVIYDAPTPPDDSLAAIARDLTDSDSGA